MTMTDTQTNDTPAAPKRAKSRRKPARRAAPKDDALLGLTPKDCPIGCSEKGCVISGKPYCAHPRKGGLQGGDMSNRKALGRLNEAKAKLAHAAVDRRT